MERAPWHIFNSRFQVTDCYIRHDSIRVKKESTLSKSLCVRGCARLGRRTESAGRIHPQLLRIFISTRDIKLGWALWGLERNLKKTYCFSSYFLSSSSWANNHRFIERFIGENQNFNSCAWGIHITKKSKDSEATLGTDDIFGQRRKGCWISEVTRSDLQRVEEEQHTQAGTCLWGDSEGVGPRRHPASGCRPEPLLCTRLHAG